MNGYSPAYFEALFTASADPWCFAERWYEQRKRALTLACLPAQRYKSGYEPGCANGELSAALATRCDRLLVSDGAQAAVEIAKKRLLGFANTEVLQAWVPDEWPDGTFDLIVLSEFLFYLNLDAVERVMEKVQFSLRPHGTVLACHWRHPVPGSLVPGDLAHELLSRHIELPKICSVMEPDFLIDVWSSQPSVATAEGFV